MFEEFEGRKNLGISNVLPVDELLWTWRLDILVEISMQAEPVGVEDSQKGIICNHVDNVLILLTSTLKYPLQNQGAWGLNTTIF